MKKIFFSLFVSLFTITTFSQRIIDKPDYGMSNIPGSITKIELTPEATILHFYLKMPAGSSFSVPKKSFIQDIKGEEKLFVTKADGVPLNKNYTMPESGELGYQLYFPPLPNTVNTIDFGEANQGGNWAVYDIVINEEQEKSLLPKELQGNWLLVDGSNQWDYGFYKSKAIVNSTIWNYKSVENNKNNYTIVLEQNNIQKKVFAQVDKNGLIKFGENEAKLVSYSKETVDNPNFKRVKDKVYSSNIFKSDSATYSGYIKGYKSGVGAKTIAIHVDDIITGAQNTYVAQIDEKGFFSIKLPMYYPHEVWVRSPFYNGSVYLEPGKSVFQLFGDKQTLYMGESASLNTDLEKFKKDRNFDYKEVISKVLDMKPADYKMYCKNWADKKYEKLESLKKANAIGAKAYQIGKLEIEYNAISNMLDYPRYLDQAYRIKNNIPRDQREIDFKSDSLSVAYYDFITDARVNNPLAVISTHSYQGFINSLQFLDLLDSRKISLTNLEIANELQRRGYAFTKEEEQLLDYFKQIEIFRNTPEQKEFRTKYGKVRKDFFEKHQKIVQELSKEEAFSLEKLENYLLKNNIVISQEEQDFLVANRKLANTDSSVKLKKYDSIETDVMSFLEAHKTIADYLYLKKQTDFRNKKLAELFDVKVGFATDIMYAQSICNTVVDQVTPMAEADLIRAQQSIQTPFIADYLRKSNDQTIAKLEANKTKTGYVVNEVPKTKGDELFATIMKKYEGKVVYVDFWATWCGPCRSGIKQIEPLKEEMKGKDVVFVYLTNQSSPESTYSAMIPDIKGEHYRVSEDEWNYLSQKFNISGIPHYVLVNKNGEIVNPKLGHHSNEGLKAILGKELK